MAEGLRSKLIARQDRLDRVELASRIVALELRLPLLVSISSAPIPATSLQSLHTVNTPTVPPPALVSASSNSLPASSYQHTHRVSFPPNSHLNPPIYNQHQPFIKTPFKMNIPHFDGTDALGWIFKINHFFNFHNTQDEQRISIVSFYLDGQALNWYQWMYNNNQLTSWTNFLTCIKDTSRSIAIRRPSRGSF